MRSRLLYDYFFMRHAPANTACHIYTGSFLYIDNTAAVVRIAFFLVTRI